MFEAAELGQSLARSDYEASLPKLQAALLKAQFALRERKIPVLVLVSGADGAGKGEFVHRLNQWLEPRAVETHAFWQTSDEECERPRYWRFWRALPARGRIGILFGSWYTAPIIQRVNGDMKAKCFERELERIAFFEKMLVEDGAVLVKLWFHLSKKAQRKRLEELEKNHATRWRVLASDWKHFKMYDEFRQASERALRMTDSDQAPWHPVEAVDRRYREFTAADLILKAIEARLAQAPGGAAKPALAPADSPEPAAPRSEEYAKAKHAPSILDGVELDKDLSARDCRHQLCKLQGKLSRLTWQAHDKKISTVMLFEGWDAAGKGSAIRRVTAAIDPRLYQIVGIAAPSDEERAHHYLWRFWRHLPRAGRVTIFDRSWYGRVLVERVEKFAQPNEWKRAFLEINDFEEQLADAGSVVLKFWIHISPDEQLRRFKERQASPLKNYKITEEDWRNRKQWKAYQEAVNEMVARTSSEFAPWTLVAGNSKKFARIQILKTICRQLEAAL